MVMQPESGPKSTLDVAGSAAIAVFAIGLVALAFWRSRGDGAESRRAR
jgi:hypothetical protein